MYSYISSGKFTNVEVMVDDIPDSSLKFAVEKVPIYSSSTLHNCTHAYIGIILWFGLSCVYNR